MDVLPAPLYIGLFAVQHLQICGSNTGSGYNNPVSAAYRRRYTPFKLPLFWKSGFK